MRRLDRWVGTPISAVLTVVRRLVDAFGIEPPEPPKRILFLKLVEQGATVIAEPALRLATKMVGRENVFVAVFSQNRHILDVLDVIPPENVITIRSTGIFVTGIDTVRAILRMRRERLDTAIDFEFFSRYSAALAYLSGAKRRVGFHSFAGEAAYRGDLMTHRLAYNLTLHASQTYRVLVEALTQPGKQFPAIDFKPPSDQTPPVFRPGEEEVRGAESMLTEVLGRSSIPPLILLNANTGDLLPLRCWSSDRYVELAQRLLERYPEVMIAFTGAPDEQQEAERLAACVDSERCVSIGGHTTLRQLLVVYGLAEILITNDSGPAHYSVMTSIDAITLFGPETPAVFGPQSPRSHILWAGFACSPCVNAFNQRVTLCTNNLCMQRISVDEVFATACRVYDHRSQDQMATNVAAISM